MATGRPDWTTRAQVDLVQVDIDVISRPLYYDRSPAAQVITFDSGLAPHAATVRASYTVPSGGRAFHESAMAYVFRSAAATTAGFARMWINHNSAVETRMLVQATIGGNALTERDHMVASAMGLLNAGDVLRLITSDTSTGGVVQYNAAMKAMEFAA